MCRRSEHFACPIFIGRVNMKNNWAKLPTKELTEGRDLRESASRRRSICLAIPALPYLWGLTDTLNYNWNCAYAND